MSRKIDGILIHNRLTKERISRAVKQSFSSLDNPGYCIKCGAKADGCEPDACGYTCEACGNPCVYGAEELLIYLC